MKLLSALVMSYLLMSCASVDQKKHNEYTRMIDTLRSGKPYEARKIIKNSPHESFDFYIFTKRFDKPVKMTKVPKKLILKGLDKIIVQLENCKGKNNCFDALKSSGFDLGREFYFKNHKAKVSIFEGEKNRSGKTSGSWRAYKTKHLTQAILNYKKRTDSKIKSRKDKNDVANYKVRTKKIQKNIHNSNFRKCYIKLTLGEEKRRTKQIHHNYGIALKSTNRVELTKKAYRVELSDNEKKISLYKNLLSKERGTQSKDCDRFGKEMWNNSKSYHWALIDYYKTR